MILESLELTVLLGDKGLWGERGEGGREVGKRRRKDGGV